MWNREHVFRFEGRLYRQRERYFVAAIPAFAPRPEALGPEEAIAFRDLRWWTLQELEAGTDVFAPVDLPGLVRRLVEQGPPERPIEVGVWIGRERPAFVPLTNMGASTWSPSSTCASTLPPLGLSGGTIEGG